MQGETGWNDYGWRQYMPEIGRWNGMDQLSESYASFSPYAYVMNSPVMMFDPDGRITQNWLNGIYNMSPKGSTTYSQFSSNGMSAWAAYDSLPDGTAASFNSWLGRGGEGYYSYWTDGNYGGYGNIMKQIVGHKVYLSNEFKGDTDGGFNYSSLSWWLNTGASAAATANIPRSGFFKYNELWHQTKTRGVSFAWEGRWKNPGAKFWRGQQVKSFEGARGLGSKLTAVGGVLLAADIAMSGEIKPSHAINAAMLVASTTGVGSIVAGVWFVADMGTMGVNYLVSGEAKGLGDMIDESVANEYGKFEMYEGLY